MRKGVLFHGTGHHCYMYDLQAEGFIQGVQYEEALRRKTRGKV